MTPASDTLRPDGLWCAVLRATARRPRSAADLVEAVTHSGSRWRRTRKVMAALYGLRRNGWVSEAHAGWTATPQGEAALRALNGSFASSSSPAATPTETPDAPA